jgi:D-threo-aldose 1-dehydrogenase
MNTDLKTSTIASTEVQVTQIGMGGAPLGKLDQSVAYHTLEKAYEIGIRYFDTAPLYGAGNSETFSGSFLSTMDRDEFTLSSKVGRLILSEEEAASFKFDGPRTATIQVNEKASRYKNNVVFDFSRDGILRSIEETLERLQLDYIDIAYIHDPDDHYSQALNESFPALADLKSQGMIKAIGAGMNEWEMLSKFAVEVDVDCFLLAGRYTLLDQSALDILFPICEQQNISLILGGPYNSGILASDLASDTTYFYDPAPAEIVSKAKQIRDVCDQFGVPLKAAALQFGLLHPAVASTIPGPSTHIEASENVEMSTFPIDRNMWRELKSKNLIHSNCPT